MEIYCTELSSKKQSDIVSVEGFYISFVKPVVINDSIILPVTLYTNEHKPLMVNADSDTSEMIFSELNSYPMDAESDIYIEIYDDEKYDLLGNLYFDSELKNFVSINGIVEFYCFGSYIYIRNFSDYGAIGKIENNQIKTFLNLPGLRMAYNGKNTQDDYYGFFVRNGRELYLLDVYSDTLYKTSLELSKDESIRNAISDGKNICISILDERDTESFTTKKAIMVDFNELKEKAYQTK